MKRDQLIFLGILLVGAIVAIVVVVATGGDEESSSSTAGKPEIEVPEGPPPTELEITDITEGDGAAAGANDTVTVQYVGVNYSDGSEFDTSWDDVEPFSLQLGTGSVIPGWEEGIPGMKVGGRRELVIPPDLAYGRQGRPPEIGPDETLIFVIDLVDVQPTQ